MKLVLLRAVAAALFVIARSAEPTATTVVTVCALLAGVGSGVEVVIVAVFVSVVPPVAEVLTPMSNTEEEPLAMLAIVQVMVPLLPTAGALHEKAGPEVCENEANVEPAGTASVRDSVVAALGPLFVTVTV